MKSIWDIQKSISRRLLVWSALSISVGLVLILLGDSFWRGFGIQAAVWGAIDAVIAIVGIIRTNRRRSVQNSPEQMSQEARKLKRILLVNFGLDVIYMAVGGALVYLRSEAYLQGHGWGIIIQGGFLFFFDFIHAQTIPPTVSPKPLQAFQGDEHLPFFWDGGRPAALLVHGFPGTPAEMRSLGEALRQEGWTVEGILLPGFGSEVATLDERRYEEWVLAVEISLGKLRDKHSPVMLTGYSMGGAVSIIAATSCQPDGLVLISPFWRIFSPLKSFIGIMLKPFLPRYFQPFKKLDLSDPKIRSGIRNFMPHVDLDAPEVQDGIRQITVPVSMLDQLRRLGNKAYKKAGNINLASLVIQGKNDELVRPQLTLKLKERLSRGSSGGQVEYLEVDAEHDIMSDSNPSWAEVKRSILRFADRLKDSSV